VYLYFVLFEYLLGQTPGMMLLSLRMEGNSGIFAVMLRNSFIFPVLPFILLWVIEPIMIAIRRRGILEQLSGTRTLHSKNITI
jgi:hypothetical protein